MSARRPTSRCSSCAKATFEFLDNYENKITGRQRLFPAGTVLGGKRVPRPQ